MRAILFFDLPVETSKQRRDYRHFVKDIKRMGFYMIQKSVYTKFGVNNKNISLIIEKVKLIIPKDGDISILEITEKQFQSIQVILGEFCTDVVNSDDRNIEL